MTYAYNITNLCFSLTASKRRLRGSNPNMASPHQLFDDTSAGPGLHGAEYHTHGSPALGIPTQAFLSEPMSNFAMAYGSSLASQGKEMVDKNVSMVWGDTWEHMLASILLFDAGKPLRTPNVLWKEWNFPNFSLCDLMGVVCNSFLLCLAD